MNPPMRMAIIVLLLRLRSSEAKILAILQDGQAKQMQPSSRHRTWDSGMRDRLFTDLPEVDAIIRHRC